MKHGSLFSGIGGFDLAAEWIGWENVLHVEINKFCQKVLKHYWPNATLYEDITKTDFSDWRGKIDIITGGFPCQPYSQAGKRKGKEDDRHLWPEMLRAIREIQPTWVVGENVPGLLNWRRGMVLAEIKADLEAAGLEVFPPVILPACGKNAPHRRDRLWIIAHSRGKFGDISEQQWQQGAAKNIDASRNAQNGLTPHVDEQRLEKRVQRKLNGVSQKKKSFQRRESSRIFTKGDWEQFPTQSPIWNGNDGIFAGLDTKAISKKQWRRKSIEAGGNAIVPHIALEIFKAIEKVNSEQGVQVSDTTEAASSNADG